MAHACTAKERKVTPRASSRHRRKSLADADLLKHQKGPGHRYCKGESGQERLGEGLVFGARLEKRDADRRHQDQDSAAQRHVHHRGRN
jgi:hypothetical protein